MIHRLILILLLGSMWVDPFAQNPSTSPVLPGVEVLCAHYADQLDGQRVGILTNPTGVDRSLASTIDRVRALPGVEVVRLFAPEHGVRGGFQAGEDVTENRDPVSGLPIVSLHGASRRVPPESLEGLDVVLYDIQDVGHRTYTFISTLTYMMEACEEAGVAFWVLDRPDPLGGDKIGGPMLDEDNLSFIGIHPVPQVYGLTPGEWAMLIKKERTPGLKLVVVPMQGWRRGMTYGELGWPWVPPSEHIPRWESAFFYAMTGTLGELGIASEGVGTPLPFELIGAPWIDSQKLADGLNAAGLGGVQFRPTVFKPRYGSYSGEFCQGVQVHLVSPGECDPARVSQTIMKVLTDLYPGRGLFKPAESNRYTMFVKALGDDAWAAALAANGPYDAVEAQLRADLEAYRQRRAPVLIYE